MSSIFAQYAKKAKAAAAAEPLIVSNAVEQQVVQAEEVQPEVALESAAPEVTVEAVVTEEVAVETLAADPFVAARERLNQTHHNLIRGRSQIVTGSAEPVVLFDEAAPTQEDDVVVETPEVSDEVVEAPVDVVPEGDVVEEPALTVTAEAVEQAEPVEQVEQAEQVEAPVTQEEATPVAVVAEAAPEQVVDQVTEQVAEPVEQTAEQTVDVTVDQVEQVEEAAPTQEDITVDAEPEVEAEPTIDDITADPADITSEVEDTRDHDIDDNDAEVTFDAEAEVIQEEQALERLEAELEMLGQSVFAVETYGINPTAVHIMRTTGLLEGTSIASLGLEAFGFEAPDHPDSLMALEALGEKIKEKAAQWSAKIVSLASSFGTKVMGVLEPIWDKITGSIKTLSGAAWDKAKATGKVVKAHPYKTLIGVILAVAATAGVVLWAGGSLPALTAKGPQVTKFVNDLAGKINKIKWPFGNVSATVAEGGAKLKTVVTTNGAAAKGVALNALDWTGSMVTSAGSQLGRAWTVTKQGVGAFGERALKVGQAVGKFYVDTSVEAGLGVKSFVEKKTGLGPVGVVAGGLTTYAVGQFLVNIAIGLTKLVYQIIAGGLRIIAATLNALVGGTRTAAA